MVDSSAIYTSESVDHLFIKCSGFEKRLVAMRTRHVSWGCFYLYNLEKERRYYLETLIIISDTIFDTSMN